MIITPLYGLSKKKNKKPANFIQNYFQQIDELMNSNKLGRREN